MKSYKIITTGILTASLLMSSCVNDLNLDPIDSNVIVATTFTKDQLKQSLAKLYASFSVPGQDGVSGGGDISGIDNGFGVYTRALWMLQELSTDEALCSWNDQTIKDFHWQTWSPTDVFNNAMYSRIIYTVTICNEFIRNTEGSTDADVIKFRAESRFLRALAYYHAIDMYGNPAFITEADKPGSFFPKQTTRAELFKYVESELKAIEGQLGAPRFEYGRADQAAAWMLLARLYLNASVYTGTAKNAECVTYCDKVIGAGYSLPANYRWNFSADNDESPEMIFAINADGTYSRSYGCTTYIIHAAVGDYMKPADFGIGGGWSGNRTTKQFANILLDTIANPQVLAAPTNFADSIFSSIKDTRVYLQRLVNWDIYNVGTYTDGIGVRKFTNLTHTGGEAEHPHNDFVCTDYPIFRLADAYLMRAEANYRIAGGSGAPSQAVIDDINKIRERAYGASYPANGKIDATPATWNNAATFLDFILDERGRELYWEGVRRTDLIRFGKFTTDKYLWQWKGNIMKGQATESYRNLFPIPASECVANKNIKQNTGY